MCKQTTDEQGESDSGLHGYPELGRRFWLGPSGARRCPNGASARRLRFRGHRGRDEEVESKVARDRN
jgi:hypothetical protein